MDRLLIIDDHPIVRRGLCDLLNDIPGLSLVADVGSAAEALEMVSRHSPTLITLDISLPDMNGLDLLVRLLAMDGTLRILVLSMHPEEQYARRALKLGAWGYMTKQHLAEELVKAVVKIMDGHKYVSDGLADILIDKLVKPADDHPRSSLSERELQVLLFLAQGTSIKETAAQLSIGAQTVSTYRRRILEKLGLETNADLVRYALRNKLIE